ncbi:MAG TPA: hypothetical protein VHG90_09110 [Acidimicrobiales bacterium]|nr:hypothetical protein [Acidimicrobiales bacterium]
MGKRVVVETGRDRRALVADAGWKQISLGSLLAGVLVAYGGFAILAGIAGGILEATGADTDITARWGDLGTVAGLVVAGLLFLAYLFAGYVAGRMARRAGALHGVAVFVLGVLIVAVVAVVVRQAAGTETVVERLRDMGLPTTGDEWSDVGTVAEVAEPADGTVVGDRDVVAHRDEDVPRTGDRAWYRSEADRAADVDRTLVPSDDRTTTEAVADANVDERRRRPRRPRRRPLR